MINNTVLTNTDDIIDRVSLILMNRILTVIWILILEHQYSFIRIHVTVCHNVIDKDNVCKTKVKYIVNTDRVRLYKY